VADRKTTELRVNTRTSHLCSWNGLKEKARGTAVANALCYKPEGHRLETRWAEWILSMYLILPAALGFGVHSASNRNEYQKQKIMFLGVEHGRCVGLTTLPPSVSRLSTQCGITAIYGDSFSFFTVHIFFAISAGCMEAQYQITGTLHIWDLRMLWRWVLRVRSLGK
jgi:hypothetical protein